MSSRAGPAVRSFSGLGASARPCPCRLRTPWLVPDRAKNSIQGRARRIRVRMEPRTKKPVSRVGATGKDGARAGLKGEEKLTGSVVVGRERY